MEIKVISATETQIHVAGLTVVVPTIPDSASDQIVEIRCAGEKALVQATRNGLKISYVDPAGGSPAGRG